MGRGRRALAVVLLAVATPALACSDEPQAEPPPVQAPAPPMPTPEQLAEAVREAPAAFAELVAVELEAPPPIVDAGTPWTDGFGNLLGVAVAVTYDRPVDLAEGAPLPVPTANGCETDCLGRFQPTPEEPYRVVPSEEPVTSSAFTLFYDVRTASLAYVLPLGTG